MASTRAGRCTRRSCRSAKRQAHAEDSDFGQAGTLVRDVMDDAARDRLAGNIVAQLRDGVTEPVLQRAFHYLRNVDQALGDRGEKGVRDGQA